MNYAVAAAVVLFAFGFAWFAWIGGRLSVRTSAERLKNDAAS